MLATTASDIVTVFQGDGTGQFTSSFTGPVDSGAFGVAAVDVDGDGVLDIAAVSEINNRVSVLRGTGGGGFAPRKTFSAGLGSRALAIADFNLDQKPDIAVANALSDDGG